MADYTRQAWEQIEPGIEYRHGLHIDAICKHLEHATVTPHYKLRINIPPGCMKSILCNVMWPTWTWGPFGWPESRWFFASYSAGLSTRDSVKARQLLESPWYRQRWGHCFTFSPDQNQKTRYQNTAKGWRFSTSVRGEGTGEHPDFIVIDDPHSAKQADSTLERQAALDWFDGTIRTRGRSRGARIVGIMQRLHEKDWSGHVASQEGWDTLILPMRAEPGVMQPTSIGWQDPRAAGELLFPALFDEAAVASLEQDMGSLRAAGQLQQRPSPADGGLFKQHWFRTVPEIPADIVQVVRYWDKAGTANGGDWTVGVLLAQGINGLWFVLDVTRGQWSPMQRDVIIKETAVRDGMQFRHVRIIGEQEPGSAGVESAENFRRMLAGYDVHADKVTDSKRLRWQPWSAMMEAGNVYLLAAPWNQKFIDEHLIAPVGENDDQIDAASGALAWATGRAGVNLQAWLDVM